MIRKTVNLRQANHLHRLPKRNYETLSPEDYLFNQRNANLVSEIREKELRPLPNANHGEGTTDEVALYGVPFGDDWKNPTRDIFLRSLDAHHPDLVFLQLSPSAYISRQRFLSHLSAVNNVEDYGLRGVETTQLEAPDSFEECIVNLVSPNCFKPGVFVSLSMCLRSVLDMLREKKLYSELDLRDGFSTFSYREVQDQTKSKALQMPFVNAINEYIIDGEYSDYLIINQALYKALMGKHKVLLGGMPELLYRRILGNALTVHELRDIFRFLLDHIKMLDVPLSMREAAYNFTPHIFQAPKDLYLTGILREAFQAATCINAFVGIHHFNPIIKYWLPPPHGISFDEACRIGERVPGETDEEQIEKQALLDVILEQKAWAPRHVVNPFSYLVDDITKVKKEDLGSMKECFRFHYNKYRDFKRLSGEDIKLGLPNFKERRENLMLPERILKKGFGISVNPYSTSAPPISEVESSIFEKAKSSFKLLKR